ncbi:MAG: ABC transporter permease [Treponema sp.]|nr:ABC transporter permease [Treponema sp.]
MKKTGRVNVSISGSLPAFAWMIFCMAIPLVYIVAISFMTKGTKWGIEPHFTFDNYKRVFDPLYIKIFVHSFFVAAVTTVLTLVIGYPFAFCVTFFSKRKQALIMTLLMIPFWTNTLIRVYGWIIILQKKGIINTVFTALNIFKSPHDFLYHQSTVMLGIVYTMLPFMILPVYNAIEKLDRTLIDASSDLGADKVQTFLFVIVPQTFSGIMTGCIMVFMPSIGIYYVSDLLGGANSILLGNLIKNQFFEARNWPFGAALSVIMSILSLALIRLYKKALGNKASIGIV